MNVSSGQTDDIILLWDVGTGKEKSRLIGHMDSVRSVIVSPDAKILASWSGGKAIRFVL